MKVAILQPNYIPWRGYFDLIASVDHFVIYDDVQYTKDDWRNRNKLLGPQGPFWLTIPVKQKGLFGQKINEVQLIDNKWQKKHWRSIEVNYQKAPYFENYRKDLLALYEGHYQYLIEVNKAFIFKILEWLNIPTKIHFSSHLKYEGEDATQRVISLCQKFNATEYISGPSAKEYLKNHLFKEKNIQLNYFDYSSYKNYPQIVSGYEHESLSILDLILNCGPKSVDYLQTQLKINYGI